MNSKGFIIITARTSIQPQLVKGWTADTMDKKRRDWRWLKLKDEYINPVQNLSAIRSPEKLSEDQLIEEYEIDPNSVTLQPIKWVDYRVEHLGQNTFEIQIPSSAIGFRAGFIEFSFAAPDESMFTVTTEVMISPDERPFEKCSGESCYGYLI